MCTNLLINDIEKVKEKQTSASRQIEISNLYFIKVTNQIIGAQLKTIELQYCTFSQHITQAIIINIQAGKIAY